jgi:hypothetical protein
VDMTRYKFILEEPPRLLQGDDHEVYLYVSTPT